MMKQEIQSCQNKIAKFRKRTSQMCWFCGHYATSMDNHCDCCKGIITRPKKHDKILDIKTELDNIVKNDPDPEFRFYVKGWCCFIKKSDLIEYQKLDTIDKRDKYYHWIKSKIDNDEIARIFH